MAARNLADFIDARMRDVHTDTVQIERDYPGVPSDWIRGLKLGRGTKKPNRARIKGLAKALQVEEAQLWRYLGRFDEVAALHNEPPPGDMPEWAIRLEKKIDDLNVLLNSVGNRVDGSAGGLAEILAALSKATVPPLGRTRVAPAKPRPGIRTRGKKQAGGPRTAWGEEVDLRLESRAS